MRIVPVPGYSGKWSLARLELTDRSTGNSAVFFCPSQIQPGEITTLEKLVGSCHPGQVSRDCGIVLL